MLQPSATSCTNVLLTGQARKWLPRGNAVYGQSSSHCAVLEKCRAHQAICQVELCVFFVCIVHPRFMSSTCTVTTHRSSALQNLTPAIAAAHECAEGKLSEIQQPLAQVFVVDLLLCNHPFYHDHTQFGCCAVPQR